MPIAFKAQEYAAAGSYTFNVPAANSGWVFVSGCGAGAAGGLGQIGGVGAGGGGGAGETVNRQPLKVTPGGTLAIVIGAGGISEAIGTKSLYPYVANVGSTTTADFAEFSRNGGLGGGDGGGITTIGSLRLYPGAGGARGGDGGSGGMGGGPIAWVRSGIAHGNMGFRVGSVGGNARIDTTPKDGTRFFGGA